MSPTEFWINLEVRIAEDGKTIGHFFRELGSVGYITNLWPYRAKKIYPPISLMAHVKSYFSQDELYEFCKASDRDDYEDFALSLHPSKECIEKQRLKRKIMRRY